MLRHLQKPAHKHNPAQSDAHYQSYYQRLLRLSQVSTRVSSLHPKPRHHRANPKPLFPQVKTQQGRLLSMRSTLKHACAKSKSPNTHCSQQGGYLKSARGLQKPSKSASSQPSGSPIIKSRSGAQVAAKAGLFRVFGYKAVRSAGSSKAQ